MPVGVLVSNSSSRAVIEVKLDNLVSKVEKHKDRVQLELLRVRADGH